MKRGDFFVAAAVLLAAAAVFLLTKGQAGVWAVVTANGQEVAKLSLEKEQTFVYEDQYKNRICTGDGAVWIEETNCPDGTCQKSGAIHFTGESIVCLPNGLVITIEGAAKTEIDGVAR